jgi:GH35 family endo-1,4-beta-xylanase
MNMLKPTVGGSSPDESKSIPVELAPLERGQIMGPLRTGFFDSGETLKVVLSHFIPLIVENEMKWDRVHPELSKHSFSAGDALVNLGEANGMAIVGHALLSCQQTPDCVFRNADGSAVSREESIFTLRSYVNTLMGCYRGLVYGWDDVNEAFGDDASWRNDWSMKGRFDYPLPFDCGYGPKGTVGRVIFLVEGKN